MELFFLVKYWEEELFLYCEKESVKAISSREKLIFRKEDKNMRAEYLFKKESEKKEDYFTKAAMIQ